MKEMDFGDLKYPALEDFQPYSYQDNYPESNTTHHGLRFDVPGNGEAYFIIEHVETQSNSDEPGGYVWYFQDSSGRRAEDLSGGFETVEEAYKNMGRQFDFETGRIFTMVVPDQEGNDTYYSYSSLAGCLLAASYASKTYDGASIDFEVPIQCYGRPFGTLVHTEIGWQLKDLNVQERNIPLDDLVKEANKRAGDKNAEHSQLPKTKEHKSPEMGR